MVKFGDVTGEKICKNCKWVKYYGAGIWLCMKEGGRLEEGVIEVNPLQKGCEWWQKKDKEVKYEV